MKKFSKNFSGSNNLYEMLQNGFIQITNDEIKSTVAKNTYTNSLILQGGTNPFENKKKIENDIQKYFDDKYFKINSKIKEIILSLTPKKGNIALFINDITIEAETIIAKYFYDGDLKLNKHDDKKYTVSHKKDVYTIEIINGSNLTSITFTSSSIIKIYRKTETETSTLNFKKQNFFEKFFAKNKNVLLNYETRNRYGDMIESVSFFETGKPEKYTKYRLNKKDFEIIFDSSDWQKFTSNRDENQIIPLEYLKYNCSQTIMTKLDFQYSKPSKYTEFNSNTGKMIKTFDIQGLYSIVFKYSFYNSITGKVLAFGKL